MKKSTKYIIYGVILGLLIILMAKMFDFSNNKIIVAIAVVGIVIIVFGIAKNILFVKNLRQRMMHQASLMDEGKFEEALKDMEDLYQILKKKNLPFAKTIRLNMSAVYSELKQFDKALIVLEELKDEEFSEAESFIYYLNLTSTYLYSRRVSDGLACYEAHKDLFDKYSNSPEYGGNVVIVRIMVLIEKHQIDEAKEELRLAKTKWADNDRILAEISQVDEVLARI